MTDKTQMFNLDSLQPLQNDDALQRRIHELCGARFNPRRRRMPGPLPQPVTRANLRLLRSEDYWVAEKSDGDRYMLFYASSGHQRGCYLIGRKTLLLRIPGTFFNEMFGHHDCLLDGELVYETQNDVKRHAYLVFDAVTYNGRNVGDQKLADRLKLVSEVVGKYRRHEKITSPPFAMQSKTIVPKKHVKRILNCITKHTQTDAHTPHPDYWFTEKRSVGKRGNKNDGVIFTPSEGGFMQRKIPILKWKFPDLQTIDVSILKHELNESLGRSRDRKGWMQDQLPVYCKGKDKHDLTYLRQIAVPRDPKVIREILNCRESSVIVEVGYDKNQGHWLIYRTRLDKKKPNFIATVMGTFDALIDNITRQTLIEVCANKTTGKRARKQLE